MPPATAWGWNPQLLAAGSAYAQGYGGQAAAFTACPRTEAATLGKRGSDSQVGGRGSRWISAWRWASVGRW